MHIKNVEKTIQEVRNIKLGDEPQENRQVIADFYREQNLNKKWDKRRKAKNE